MKSKLMIMIAAFAALSVAAQRSQIRPDWLLEKPVAGNNTYEYVVEHGVGLTENAALEEAIHRIHQYYTRRLGQKIESTQDGVALQRETYNIPFKKVCEYTEKQKDGTYCVHVLCQVAVRGDMSPRFEEYYQCNSINKYKSYMHKKNVSAIVASALVPGSGQMIKRHYGEGIATLVGEVALIGAGAGTYIAAKNKENIMNSYNIDYETYQSAQQSQKVLQGVSYTMFGLAVVVYGINLWRAYTMDIKQKQYVFYPTINSNNNNYALGLGATIKF